MGIAVDHVGAEAGGEDDVKPFYWSVPLTPAIDEFLQDAEAVLGKLTGGFQSTIKFLLSSTAIDAEGEMRLFLDDCLMGRLWRYTETFVAGGFQDTHLPKLMVEVRRLMRAKQYQEGRKPEDGLLF